MDARPNDFHGHYARDRRRGRAAARDLADAGRGHDVLRALAEHAAADDLAHIAFDGAEQPADRLGELIEAISSRRGLEAVMAYRSSEGLSKEQADALVEATVTMLGAETCVDTWRQAGMLDPPLCSLLAGFDDRTAYHLALGHSTQTTAVRAERALDDLCLDDLARDVARRAADAAVLEAACTTQAGRPPAAALEALRVGLQRSPASAADRMVELGWEVVETGATIAAGRRWTTTWKWLAQRAQGDELIDLATRTGMTARDIIKVLGPKQRPAVRSLRQLDVTTARIEQLLRELDLDDDHIGRHIAT